MILVEVYSQHECHLCNEAKNVLKKIQAFHPFELKEINIHENDKYYNEFHERIPVIFINKEFAFQHHVLEQAFIKKLQSYGVQ